MLDYNARGQTAKTISDYREEFEQGHWKYDSCW